MPLTKGLVQTTHTNDTVQLPTVAVDGKLGVRGTAVFENGVTVTGGSSLFNGSVTTGSSLVVAGQASIAGETLIGTSSSLGQLTVVPSLATVVPITIRQAPLQSVDSFRMQNSSGSNLVRITAAGNLILPTNSIDNSLNKVATISLNNDGTGIAGAFGKYLPGAIFQGSTFQPLIIKSTNSPSTQEIFTVITLSNLPVFAMNSLGEITSQSNNQVPLNIRATPNTALAINSISGNGSTVTYDTGLTAANIYLVGSTVTITGATTAGFNGTFSVISVAQNTFTVSNTTTGTTSTATAVIGAQVANLTNWKDQAGSVIASVSASGALTAVGVTSSGAVALNYPSPTISSNNPTAASIFTSTVTGVTIGSSTIKTTKYPAAPAGTTGGTVTQAAQLSGYLGMPQNAQAASGAFAYTLVAADAGKHLYVTGTPTSVTITIPANSAVAYEIGTTIVLMNDLGAATNVSIAITTDVLQLSGAGTTGTRTLARYGVASITKVTATKWIISGNGLT